MMNSLRGRRRTCTLALVATLTLLVSGGAGATPEDSAASHFALAKLLAGEGQLEPAAEHFDRAVSLAPDAPLLRVEYAEFLFRSRQLPEALVQISAARELAPEDPAVLRTFGQLHLASNNPSAADVAEAIEALETLRKGDPSDLMGMVTLAQAYESTGRVSDAADVIGQLVGLHTDNERLKRYWIDLLERSDRGGEATEVLRELVKLEQRSVESRLELADREATDGNFTAAIELLQDVRKTLKARGAEKNEGLLRRLVQNYLARSQSPGLSGKQRQSDLDQARAIGSELGPEESLGLEARTLALSGQPAKAIALLSEVPVASAADVPNQLLLAQLLERVDRQEEAALAYQRAIAVLPAGERLGVERQRVLFFARNDDWQEVEHLVSEIVAGSEPDEFSGLRALRIEALVQLDRYADALSLLRSEGGEHPVPGNLMARAEVFAAQGKAKLARKVLATIDQNDPGLEQRRANVLIALGDVDGALEVLDQLIGDPSFATLFSAAQFLSRDGLFDRAESYLQRALGTEEAAADESLQADANFLLGQALERQGKISSAAERFRQVLEVRGDDPLALNYLGYMLADAGQDLPEAVALIERAVAIDPNNGAYLDSLGWAQFRLGNVKEAASSLERAAELNPRNATILDHLGDAYVALERVDEARAAYQKALAHASEEEAKNLGEKIKRLRGSLGSQ